MRILHIISTLDPHAGGPPAVALRLAAAQAALGHEVCIAAYADPAAAERTERSLNTIPGIGAVERLGIAPIDGPGERVFAARAGAVLAQRLARTDAVHVHNVWDSISRVGAAKARAARVPYAFTPHGMLDPWCLGATPAKRIKKHIALALAYRRMLNGAAFIHALNQDERDLMRPLGLRPPVEVIPNGVFLDELANPPPPGTFRAAHPELGSDPYVLFLSRVHYKKGLDYLADAFAALSKDFPALRLVVAGPDDGALAPLLEQARALGIEGRVHAVGSVYGRDKLGAFTDAAAFCLPSRQEGFSMAITEALACGLPVVISDQCHFPEVAEVGAGVVVPLNAGAVAAGLRGVLAGPGARERMGRAGRALVESRFTWPVIAARSIECYERHSGRR